MTHAYSYYYATGYAIRDQSIRKMGSRTMSREVFLNSVFNRGDSYACLVYAADQTYVRSVVYVSCVGVRR